MRTMQKVLLLLFTVAVSFEMNAQSYFFAESRESGITPTSTKKRVIIPERYRSVTIDNQGMQSFLGQLPFESTIAPANAGKVIELPMPDGGKAKFRVWESPVMDPALSAKFPQIRTYAGQGVDDPTATIKMDYTETGFHAMILSDNHGGIFIDPYRQLDTKNYIVYYKKDFKNKDPFFEYGVPGSENLQRKGNGNRPMAGPCVGTQLRSYRLAVACTGEYARAAVGNSVTIPQALSAIVTTVNRVDGVYEREVAISLNLVANNNLVVFTDPATDPFTANNDGSALLDESQSVIDANIGSANYDLGHTFSTGAGGIAQLGSVCSSAKARAVTGSPNPVGDPYDIDYVAHEMGHQFDASHSFNANTGVCGGNRNGSTAVEPGSGITIMSYAGICNENDLGVNSIPYFHAASMDEINTFTVTGGGTGCGTVTATGNITPVVNAGNNFTIPRSTPFVLTGSASDANGDPVTYSWEQMDTGPSGDWNAPSGNAPLFRSFPPVTTPIRHFPRLFDQLNNVTTVGELLPSYARNMTFRLTARDNRAGGAGVCYDEASVAVSSNSGPFVVTVPSATGITWSGGTTQVVSWNVANTNLAPVSCANVSIQLSTDGGLTFPITVIASTANDGSEAITVPNNVTTQARIRVMGVGNIFYDISNNNFSITAPQSGFDFTTPEAARISCAGPAATSINLGTISVLGYNTPITLSASGNPPGTSVSFSSNNVIPGTTVQVTLNNTDQLPFDSSYVITVTGVSGSITKTQELTYTVQSGTGPVVSDQPDDVAVCKGAEATFSVASAESIQTYQWQVSSNGGQSFINIPGATEASYTITSVEDGQNNFVYRVLLIGQCNVTTSDPALLTVYNLPQVSLTTPQISIVPGETSTLTAVVIPGSGTGVVATWFFNGNPINVTGNSLQVNVSALGSYQVKLSDDNGCTNESPVVTIRARESAELFIYPSPNEGRFTLSYYNASGGNTKQSVTIYDARGAKIYYKVFTFNGPYQLHDIDIRGKQRGVYFVVVGDAAGKKIIDGKVLVN